MFKKTTLLKVLRKSAHHDDVPGAYERDVFHQVLPRQHALHVDVESRPVGCHLLEARVQAEGGKKEHRGFKCLI